MDRKEFLATLGIGAAAIACSYCFGGCNKADFMLDLANAAYAALKSNGGYVYNGGVIVARTSTGSYVAVSQTCTHQGTMVQFDGSQFTCPAHGSIFNTDGSVARGPAASPLAKYNTSLNGNSLRVYS
jgi:cytochrome b6-f complex iron-sulfur subunit